MEEPTQTHDLVAKQGSNYLHIHFELSQHACTPHITQKHFWKILPSLGMTQLKVGPSQVSFHW